MNVLKRNCEKCDAKFATIEDRTLCPTCHAYEQAEWDEWQDEIERKEREFSEDNDPYNNLDQ